MRRQSQTKLPTSYNNFPKIQKASIKLIKQISESQPKRPASQLRISSTINDQKNVTKKQILQMPSLKGPKRIISSHTMHLDPQQKIYDLNAQAFGVYREDLSILLEANTEQKRQIASLTKIMTMLVTIKLSQKYGVQIENTYFRVSAGAANTSGTTAELESKEWITIEDLLYALMLPSGNDAAVVLAENFGAYLFYQKQVQMKTLGQIKSLDVTKDALMLRVYQELFLKQMNIFAKQIGMQNSLFMNPHGLDCKEAYSTVKDVIKMLKRAADHHVCFKVISSKTYFGRIKISIGKKQTQYREVDWLNTNRLLWKNNYLGGKTGQTISAGSCLANICQYQSKRFYVVVLGCQNKQDRFTDTEKLVNGEILK